MIVKIKIQNRSDLIIEKVSYTKVVGSFYMICFNEGKYIFPVHKIIDIKEVFENEDEETKVLGEDNIKV